MLQQSAATIPSSRLWVVVGVILCWFSLIVVGNEVPYEEYVDILGGTDSRYDISFGNTLPLVTRPWGFNSYAPQTDNDPTYPGWWFHPSDKRFFGLRVTHQPSPWIGDYGSFLMKAYMPSNASATVDLQDQYSGFSSQKSKYHPYFFETELFVYGNNNGLLRVGLTPTSHGGIMTASFPAYIAQQPGDEGNSADPQTRRISVVLGEAKSCFVDKLSDGAPILYGTSNQTSGGSVDELKHYFVMAIYKGKYGDEIPQESSTNIGKECWIDFDPQGENDNFTIRFATSLISHHQALSNLEQEVGVQTGKNFLDIKNEAKSEWRKTLSRISVKEQMEDLNEHQAKDLLTVFYSSLYRASVFPRQLGEWDADNKKWVHWSPYLNSTSFPGVQPKAGNLSADSGFWDAWNTIYPLLSLSNRPQLGKTIDGWLNAYKEGGWLPKWASPGYRGSMIGTMGDVAIGSAIVQGIPGFDVELAYQAIHKDAFVVPPEGLDGVGRVCLESYLKNGFVVRGANMTTGGGCYEVVSRSLNYYQSDYAVAQAAQVLNSTDDYTTLLQRSQNYSQLFNRNGGFFRSKTGMNGDFTTPFDQYAWGGDYTEGGPWQYRFYVPFDGEGLKELYETNGLDYCQLLEKVQSISPAIVHIGGYGSVIHEQTELSDHCWGQNAHNNQPIHHQLFMSMVDGVAGECANMGRSWIRKVLLEMYQPNAQMFPGDEDNGEMGGWFVLSALGLYSRSPSSGIFQFTSPLFNEIDLDLSDNGSPNKVLTIKVVNNNLKSSKIKEVQWNGTPLAGDVNGIEYKTIAQGGVLTYVMGE